MSLKVSFHKSPKGKADAAAVLVYKGNKLGTGAAALDRECGGLIAKHLKKQKKFTGAKGQALVMTAPANMAYAHIVLVGMDDAAKVTAAACEAAGGKLAVALAGTGAANAVLVAAGEKTDMDAGTLAAHIAMGMNLRSYGFDKYKTVPKKDTGLKTVTVAGAQAVAAEKAYARLEKAARGVFFARDMVNEPPNNLYPDSFAKKIKAELTPHGVKVEIFDEKQMAKMGFGAALAVGQGSARQPRIVVMRWNGAGASKKSKGPVAFVGKGVTFDTGGVDIKPADGMLDMKMDMAGAAAVAGAMKTLALRKAKADVVGIVGLAENMPSHNAYRPSDILKSLSGKTVEVMNTDAEGRLVLIDCLTYVQRKYKPRAIVDLATLTGAIMIALGAEYAGAFVNDDKFWQQIDRAGAANGERLWRMPLDEAFREELDSQIADIKSLGNTGRYGGSCVAAGFLERFIENGTPWAHLDIAGMALCKGEKPTCPRGHGTGFGVRILDSLVANDYEA